MTFEKTRISLGNKNNSNKYFNLNRLSTKSNLQIVGGVSKLFKYFIRNYNPENIITYADRRFSTGQIYEKLGFTQERINKPSYSYFHKNRNLRYHRFNLRKDKIIKEDWYDNNKTVNENLLHEGYYKIYDSGTIKYNMIF